MGWLWHMKQLIVLVDWGMSTRDTRINQILRIPRIRIRLNGVKCLDFEELASQWQERKRHLHRAANV